MIGVAITMNGGPGHGVGAPRPGGLPRVQGRRSGSAAGGGSAPDEGSSSARPA